LKQTGDALKNIQKIGILKGALKERNRNKKMKNKAGWKILVISIALVIIASGIVVNANTTYNMDSEKDNYPLMQPFENHFKPNPEHILIVEVYPDTYLYGDTAGEFIRIHNPTENSINIGGWQITDLEGVIAFSEWANISAGDSLYLAYNANAFHDEILQKADFYEKLEAGIDSIEFSLKDGIPSTSKKGIKGSLN